jgi:hypothetical protein
VFIKAGTLNTNDLIQGSLIMKNDLLLWNVNKRRSNLIPLYNQEIIIMIIERKISNVFLYRLQLHEIIFGNSQDLIIIGNV